MVDSSTGASYVADFASNGVERFNAAHEPEPFTGVTPNIVAGKLTGFAFQAKRPSGLNQLAVDATTHTLYVLGESQPVKAFQQDGEPSLFTAGPGAGTNELPGVELCGVAVDTSGAIYASEAERVRIYAASGVPLAVIPVQAVCNLAVDSTGAVYLTHFNGPVEKWVPSEFPVTSSTTYKAAFVLDERSSSGVTTDTAPASDHVFVDERQRIVEYEPDGTEVASFGASEPGALANSEGVAVNPSTGDVYVSDTEGKRQVEIFGPPVVVPDVTTGEATGLTTASGQATFNGVVNPDGAPVTGCKFEYGPTTAYGSVAECSKTPGSGTQPVAVSATVTGLTPAATYHFRLVAGNANGPNRGLDASVTAPGVALAGQWASSVTATSATLNAQVDPNGAATSYRFEYGPTASYGASVPAPDEQIGAGSEAARVSQHLQNLQPGTLYHYRVVATGLGVVEGSDQTFTTQGAGGTLTLPDNRAWELVSPADKHGALIEPLTQVLTQASPDGSRMLYTASSPVEAQPPGSLFKPRVLAVRGATGWSSQSLVTPHEAAPGPAPEEWDFFSEDLSRAIVQPAGAFPPAGSPDSLSSEASEQTAFLHTNLLAGSPSERCTTSCFQPLVTGKAGLANVPPGTVFGVDSRTGETCPPQEKCGPFATVATPDLSHILLQSAVGLTEGTNGAGIWEWTAGTLTPIAQGSPILDAISDDGSRVVLGGLLGSEGFEVHDLSLGQTVRVDAPAPGVTPTGPAAPVFRFATRDGSRVFFSDTQALTKDSGATEGTVREPDLYECHLVVEEGKLRCNLTDLTPLGEGGEHANVPGTGVLDVSPDGSWVYFVANGKLNAGPGVARGDCEPAGGTIGTCNLFVRHDGVTRLIAVLSSTDVPDWWWLGGQLINHTARVSPDGQWLTFMSARPLTGYDNRDAVTGRADEEVFLYHAPTGSLVCASCNPSGARPAGIEYAKIDTGSGGLAGNSAVWAAEQGIAANIPSWTAGEGLGFTRRERYQSRFLSNGGRLYFNSHDALVPQDVNGTEDVYQYEPPGQGDCSTASTTFSARSGGCVGLISSGTDARESAFLDASESGGDVFFLTSAQLSPQDVDSSLDVYDAHECTSSSPCLPQPTVSPPPCASGEACKPAPTPQPGIFGPPASSTFSGPGNQPSPSPGRSKTAAQVGAEKLAKALKACRAKRNKHKRLACEKQARERYGHKSGSRRRPK